MYTLELPEAVIEQIDKFRKQNIFGEAQISMVRIEHNPD